MAILLFMKTFLYQVLRRSQVWILLKPWFFQASSFQLLKLENLLRWSFFTFIYNRSTNMNYFIYTLHLDTFVFLAKVKCNLKLLFSQKHTEDVLVFFSKLEINGRKLNEGLEEECFAVIKTQIFSWNTTFCCHL